MEYNLAIVQQDGLGGSHLEELSVYADLQQPMWLTSPQTLSGDCTVHIGNSRIHLYIPVPSCFRLLPSLFPSGCPVASQYFPKVMYIFCMICAQRRRTRSELQHGAANVLNIFRPSSHAKSTWNYNLI